MKSLSFAILSARGFFPWRLSKSKTCCESFDRVRLQLPRFPVNFDENNVEIGFLTSYSWLCTYKLHAKSAKSNHLWCLQLVYLTVLFKTGVELPKSLTYSSMGNTVDIITQKILANIYVCFYNGICSDWAENLLAVSPCIFREPVLKLKCIWFEAAYEMGSSPESL